MDVKRMREIFQEIADEFGQGSSGGYKTSNKRNKKGGVVVKKGGGVVKKGGVVAGAKKKKSNSTSKQNNPWIKFLKKYAKRNGITYSEALKDPMASKEYKKYRGNSC